MDAVIAARTLYDVLDVGASCSPEDVRHAFRRRSLQVHPDKCADPRAAEAFHVCAAAMDVLSNPQQRAAYDAALAHDAERVALVRSSVTVAVMSALGSGRSSTCVNAACFRPAAPSSQCDTCAGSVPRCPRCGEAPAAGFPTCLACAMADSKRGRCAKFGCLRETSSGGLCERCSSAPRKCSEFGCLRQVRPPATACSRHAEAPAS